MNHNISLTDNSDLSALFGIEFEPVRTVPRALNSVIVALQRTSGPDARALQTALERLEAVSEPLSEHSAAALLRGFQIVGERSGGKTARKLGMMAQALRAFVPEEASDNEVITLWEAVIALAQRQPGQEWTFTVSAWTQGLRTLRQAFAEATGSAPAPAAANERH